MKKRKRKIKKLQKGQYIVYEIGSRRVWLTLTWKRAREIKKHGA